MREQYFFNLFTLLPFMHLFIRKTRQLPKKKLVIF